MEIPRNIRQIGDIDRELGLYLEDYVATFMEKMRRRNDTCVGILLGRQEKEKDTPCLFVRGAVVAKDYEVDDGRVVMTASAWNQVYEQAEKCFKEVEICGWFLCSSDSRMTDIYNLQKSHNENFRSPHQVLFVYDGNREEETIYRFDAQGGHRLQGYYIYYERNEQMQEYMISREPARTTEFAAIQPARGVSDEAARQFRSIMDGTQEKEQAASGGNTISKALRTVSVAALLLGAGFGLAAWYKYDGMQGIREVASIFTGKDPEETGTVLAEKGQEETGQALVREVAGEVKPTEKPAENAGGQEAGAGSSPAETPSAAGAAGEPTAAAGETTAPANAAAGETSPPVETAAETAPGSQEADENAAPAAAEAAYQEYVVKRGDTLSLICKEHYGRGTPALVAEVCKFNGMANANLIYEGQVLKLPEE